MQISEIWTALSLLHDCAAYRRVDELHPYDLYAGIEGSGERSLMLVTDQQPPDAPYYREVEVVSHRRHDARWVVLFRLRRKEFEHFFALVCQDLIDSSRSVGSGASAGNYLLARLARWRRLLELAPSEILPPHTLRGLLGELLFLADYAIPKWGASESVQSWGGPFDASQDFSLSGLNVEVKTRTPQASTVSVSSIEQLESVQPLLLVVASLASADSSSSEGFTPSSLVARVRLLLTGHSAAELQFELCLATAGYSDHEEYDRMYFRLADIRFFGISGGFPRIRSSVVPQGVGSVCYEIDLAACRPFECQFPGGLHGT